MKNVKRVLGFLVTGWALWSVDAGAATMNNYCIVPPFIQEIAKPNLLMIIDNSASMNDLAYDDKGYKRCSTTTAQSCAVNADCPSGETCTQARNPYYCFDETFSSANSYVGYFDPDKKYQYNFSTSRFQEVGSIPASCAMTAVADQVYCKLISNTLHLNIDKTDPALTKYFYASGKFLNWLTASKFDVEKQVLTGGKYVTKVCSNNADKACLIDTECGSGNTCNATSAFLQPESRGCVGMGYVKDVNAADFQNYATGITNPNTDLGLTFLVKGPANPYNAVVPSTGGQTYLEIFSKSGTPYDYQACQEAINAIATAAGAGQVTAAVGNCLASGGAALGTCQQNSSRSCAASFGPGTPNCDVPITPAHCTGDASRACTVATEATDCFIAGAKTCSVGRLGLVCTGNSDCNVKACSLNSARTCSVDTNCVQAEVLGRCAQKTQTACRTDANCMSGGGNINNGPCVGYVAAFNDGVCGVGTAGVCTSVGDMNVGPCIAQSGGYVGPCVFTAQTATIKTKISFSQSMQACWNLRKNSTPIGIDEVNTVKNQCSDIYGSYKTCSNNAFQLCTVNADCGAGNTCLDGPAAIQSGNPALMCSISYEGQMFEKIGNAWVLRSAMPAATPGACLASDSVADCMKKIHTQFCNQVEAPAVTDPTNPPSASTATENLPAVLSGIGVEAQLGAPILTLPVKIETAAVPIGLVQEYVNKIRVGLMVFNTFGSSSETSTDVPLPAGKLAPTKVCSHDHSITCTQPVDCGGNSCIAETDFDGAKIISLIGKGKCAAVTTTPCTSAANCSSGQLCSANLCWTPTTTECTKQAHCSSTQGCIADGPGSHTEAGLINKIDFLRSATWTPFAEAFYNAIGYFGKATSDATGVSSRTDLRLNSADFPDDMNPSEYVCQANSILLVTDGSSAADQNSSKTTVVDTYKALSGNVTGTCPKQAGSQDLDDLAWIARHRNINSFERTTASPEVPAKKSEFITSYIVFNGSDNGEAGDCNNTTLLTKTANNGGTDLLKADIPSHYLATLRKAFESVAGGTASGTAASILSNSEGSGANILQAVFYPTKDFETETGQPVPTSATWIGEMQNLWYFVDPFIGNSSVREDTPVTAGAPGNKALHLVNDYVTEFQFKGGDTIAVLKKDANGDGVGDSIVTAAEDSRVISQGYCSISSALKCATVAGCPSGETCVIQSIVHADSIGSLWRAGGRLWDRNLTATPKRKLYTHLYGVSATGCASSFSHTGLVDLVGDWDSLSTDDKCIVQKLLQATDADEAVTILKFVEGYDHADYGSTTGTITGTINIGGVATKPRSRSVKIGGTKKAWKLGDIITSTPRIQSFNKLNNFHLDPPAGYGDTTYANDAADNGFANSADYKGRGMAYAGANDGMLHAFKLGSLKITGTAWPSGQKAALEGSGLGDEQWAFIPKNVLPYLKYLADPVYSHLYLVDGPTKLLDASIGYNDNSYIPAASLAPYSAAGCDATGSGSHTAYWACKADPATTSNKSWRSILIGSMGIGGASAELGATCTDCVKNPIAGAGKSSYFALDITDPNNPQYLWEFSHDEMGYATTGAAVARIGHKFVNSGITYKDTNGRWFAVVGSGPTGPIDTIYHQFKGKSENPLRLFVLDLKTGTLVRKIDTSIANAFAGAMSAAPIDTDRARKLSDGFYSDDALYFGYSNDTTPAAASPTWNGGIMRLLTDESIDPANWSLSTVISNIGPVTTAVSKLQDRKFKELWLFTGAGRYFFKGDDNGARRKILAIKDPCYDKVNDDMYTTSAISGQSPPCTNVIDFASASGDFADQSTAINSMIDKKGWFIDLVEVDNVNNFGAERIITEPVAMPNGAVFFTSFMPSFDICNYGGKSFMWGMKYDTGGTAAASQLKGKALVQVSTGAFEEIDLPTALTDNLGRKMTTPMVGKPPTDPPPIVSAAGNKPLKRILHIQEK